MALTLPETQKLLTVLAVDQPVLQPTPATIAVWADELQDHWITYDLCIAAARLFRRRSDAELQRFRFLEIAVFHHYLRKARDVERAAARSEASRHYLPPGKPDGDPYRVKFPEKFSRLVAEGKARAAGDRAYRAAITSGATRDEATEQGKQAYRHEAALPGGLDSLANTDRT